MVCSLGKPEMALRAVLLAMRKPPPISVSRGKERLLNSGLSTKARVPPVLVKLGAAKLVKESE